MEVFGDDYVVHNLPLILVCGLDDPSLSSTSQGSSAHSGLYEGGFRVKIDLPALDTSLSASVLRAFRDHDGSLTPWKAQTPSSSQRQVFKIKTVGRVFSLPPRKAPPPPHSPRLTAGSGPDSTPPPLVLHSPLSPLTPTSPLYPDGIITPSWITKHQHHLPCALVVCFTLAADPNTSSLLDNRIKSEINNIRSALSTTSYKTRIVIVLLPDGSIDASDLEERLTTIRKAVTVDLKSLSFCHYNASNAEVDEFVRNLLSTLYPNCIEYYRDLSKHTRRKRNRGSTPAPTIRPAKSHPLPSQGWNTRYEFKLGVFAEFRQEMDAACRNYETAYESLFSSDVIESIPVRDIRFNEARLLADVLAIRIIRCLLWNGQSTNSIKAWSSHRDRVESLLDRREKGTKNYAWEAWQSIWAKTMAQLISRSELSSLNIKVSGSSDVISVVAGPDKSLAVGERLTPWGQLAHEGYWLELAQSHTSARRQLASELAAEDRSKSMPSKVQQDAGKPQSRTQYLTLQPHEEMPQNGAGGFDYTSSIIADLDTAIKHFETRGQLRKQEALLLKQALEYFEAAAWDMVISIVAPIWKNATWRQSGWWKLLQYIGWLLFESAEKARNAELLAVLSWELGNANFDAKPNNNFDMSHALDGCDSIDRLLNIALNSNDCATRICPSFAFVKSEGHVGEPVECQFVLSSCSQRDSAPVKLSGVKIVFEGALKPVYINHVQHDPPDAESGDLDTVDLPLNDSSRFSSGDKRSSTGNISSLVGEGDLTLGPGQTRIFNLRMIPREAGEVSVASVTLMLEEEKFSLMITMSEMAPNANQWFEIKRGQPSSRPIAPTRDVSRLEVLPKPPKVEINARNFEKTYYVNEEIHIDVEVENNEDEEASVSIDMRLISPIKGAASIRWLDEARPELQEEEQDTVQALSRRDLGTLGSRAKNTASLMISDTIAALDHELEITVTYRLSSDEETVLQKILALDVAVVRPFEANYDFKPRLLPQPWPNFFEMSPDPAISTSPQGLQHMYQVTANLFSFATEQIVIEAIILTTTKITAGTIASSTTGVLRDEDALYKSRSDQISAQIEPEQTRSFDFDLSVQKHVLGDRHTVNLGLSLEIGWRRPNSSKVNTTILEVPPFQILMAEPRVLLTLDNKKPTGASGMHAYSLTYTLENPSMHFLTFNVTMDSSEDFAFSGPKASAVTLVPVSRHAVKYKVLPNKSKQWVRVQLNVVDAYFNQTLRVQPAGDGVKVDKKGGVCIWVD